MPSNQPSLVDPSGDWLHQPPYPKTQDGWIIIDEDVQVRSVDTSIVSDAGGSKIESGERKKNRLDQPPTRIATQDSVDRERGHYDQPTERLNGLYSRTHIVRDKIADRPLTNAHRASHDSVDQERVLYEPYRERLNQSHSQTKRVADNRPDQPYQVENRNHSASSEYISRGHYEPDYLYNRGHYEPLRHSDVRQQTHNRDTCSYEQRHYETAPTGYRSDDHSAYVRPQAENVRTQTRKQRDPEKFDGDKIEWVDYHKHFETVATWNGWGSEEKAMQLIMALKGEALMSLSDLPLSSQSNYELLVDELTRRYNPSEREAAWKLEFRQRERRPNESVMQYGDALRRLAQKAFPNMNYGTREMWVMDQFNNGLGSWDMKKHVQFGHPNSLNQAISLAVEYEAFESQNKLTSLRKPPPIQSGNVYKLSEENQLETERLNMLKMQTEIKEILLSLKNNQQTYSPECFYCKEIGHMKGECPRLQAKLARERDETMHASAGNDARP